MTLELFSRVRDSRLIP